jgi:hypothetical protein
MNSELQEFFSLIGKAKKEKDDEFKSLVGEINIDSRFLRLLAYPNSSNTTIFKVIITTIKS